MNFELPHIPYRENSPRENGLTMMMDKGLSWRETENFIDSSAHLTDIVKFGFGTSYVTNDLQKKLDLYKAAGIFEPFCTNFILFVMKYAKIHEI